MKSFCQKWGLELHGCSLRDSGAAASRLYVSVGEKRLALGSVSTTRPFCPIRFTSLSPETTFSCEGGELLLSGLVLNDDMYDDDFAEPPSKKPRMEAPAETPAPRPASPKTAPKATAAPTPKAATPAPKAATPVAAAPKKEPKASDKAVTQRTLPSGLRYEVLQRGNGPQAIVGKPVTWDLTIQFIMFFRFMLRSELLFFLNHNLHIMFFPASSWLKPTTSSEVKVRYEGRLGSTGGRFDKGVIKFRLGMGEVIDGWDQGVILWLR